MATALKVPKNKVQVLHDLLVEHDVTPQEIKKAGGPEKFMGKFLDNFSNKEHPLLKKLIGVLITKGITALGG